MFESGCDDIKTELCRKCELLKDVIQQNSDELKSDDTLFERIDNFQNDVVNWRYRLYMIGEFSCGKSTLLNTFFQRPDLLPRANTAETAVTTEITYGEFNTATLVYLDDHEEDAGEYNDSVADRIRELGNSQSIKKVILKLDLPVLKKYESLSFVDMPGLSSTNVAHEDSLNRFIQEGGLGIICVAMPDGDVKNTLLQFLKKMVAYDAAYNVVLTKMDDSPSSERESIKNKIVSTIESHLGQSVNCAMVSTFQDSCDISEFEKMIENLAHEQNRYFEETFKSRFEELIGVIVAPLVLALRQKFSSEENDANCEKIQMEMKNLPLFMKELSMDMHRESTSIVQKVLSKASEAMNGCMSGLIQRAKSGGDISGEVRSSLNTAIQYNLREELADLTFRMVEKAKQKLEDAFADVNTSSINVDVGGFSSGKQSSGGNGVAGAGIGALGGAGIGAAIGSVVPVIGTAVGAIVGGIIGLIGGGIAGSRMSKDSEIESKVEAYVNNSVQATEPQIARTCSEAIAEIERQIQQSMETQMQKLSDQLSEIKREIESGREVFEEKCRIRTELKEYIEKMAAL